MNLHQTEPEFILEEPEEMWGTEKVHNYSNRDLTQVVADLEALREQSQQQVIICLEIADSIRVLVSSVQEQQ